MLPFGKRSRSFKLNKNEGSLKVKEILAPTVPQNIEIEHSVQGSYECKFERRKSCSHKDLFKMEDSDEKSPSFDSHAESPPESPPPVPNLAMQLSESLKESGLFNKQKVLHNRRSMSANHLNVSDEFISSIKLDETSNEFNRPTKFPSVEENVVPLRKKTLPNAARAKTVDYDLSGIPQSKVNELKGVSKIVIGDELCSKIDRHSKLIFEDNEIQIVSRTGQKNVLRSNVELKPGIQHLEKKKLVLHDVDNTTYELHFDTSKEAKHFADNAGALYATTTANKNVTIKSKLLRLLGKRTSREILMEKGILLNEPIFGNTIQNIYQIYQCVPEFLTKSIRLIELPVNVRSVGIYRTSGNLATIQRIRLEVDKGNLAVLDEYWEDVDVLTGALKLFFRELKEPLIPFHLSKELAQSDLKTKEIKSIISRLPDANYQTLMCLVRHLLRIAEMKESNRMDIYNLSICWGPSLMFISESCVDIMTQSTNNSKVLDLLLNFFKDNPKELMQQHEIIKLKSNSLPKDAMKVDNILKSQKKSSSCSNLNDMVYEVVTKLIELIEDHSKCEEVYKKPGTPVKIDKILKKLNKGKLSHLDKYKGDVNDLAGALKRYVSDLQGPLIPKEVFYDFHNCDTINSNISRQKLRINLDNIKRKETLIVLLKHLLNFIGSDRSKTIHSSLFEEWKNILIKTNQDDHVRSKLMEVMLDIYSDVPTPDIPKPMPDVIKDIEARFSKYDNVPNHSRGRRDSRGEANVLDEKTGNE